MNTSSSAFFHDIHNGDTMRTREGDNSAVPQPVEATVLGKKVEYKFEYDPSVLVAVPRQENRNLINIKNSELPFIGVDVWNAYEISTLTTNGQPFCGIAKIVYPCTSEFIVESKSLKLYLNSFNMTKLNKTIQGTKKELEVIISSDLSKLLQTSVRVSIFDANKDTNYPLQDNMFGSTLEYFIEKQKPDLQCTVYNEDPNLLLTSKEFMEPMEEKWVSNILRSNCKITKQPDWGTVYINYKATKLIVQESLYKYLVSFRNEAHFHEEICETIYKRLFDVLKPSELFVACFYTRRGGIDINPIRSTSWEYIKSFDNYMNEKYQSYKQSRQ
jgi:7-cyano-7-deazaguanine reductase